MEYGISLQSRHHHCMLPSFCPFPPYKVRLLVSNSIYAKKDRNGPVPTKSLLKMSPDAAMLFAPFRCTHPSPPVPPFLFIHNPSPKDIAGSDIMKLKIS